MGVRIALPLWTWELWLASRSWLWHFRANSPYSNIREKTHPHRDVTITHRKRVLWTTDISFYKTAKRKDSTVFKRISSERGTFVPYKDVLKTIFFSRNSAQMVQETHYGLLRHANSLLNTVWEHRYNHEPPRPCRFWFCLLPFFIPFFILFFFSFFLLLSPSLPLPLLLNCTMM